MFTTLLACIGLMWLLRYGSIFNWPRNFLSARSELFDDLFKCSLCLGFWCGVAGAISQYFIEWETEYFFLPFISSAACWFGDSVLRVLQTLETYLRETKTLPPPPN